MSDFVRARLRAQLVMFVVVLGAGALLASPAGAILVKLPHGGYAGYDPMSGAKTPQVVRNFDAAFTNLDYSGGPVMPSNTNYTIVWQPSNYGSHTAFQTGYTSGVNKFFIDMAAASGQSTNSDAVSTQYNDSSGNTAAYSFANGGLLTDTDALPANGCAAASGEICITDAQIQTELNSYLSAHGLKHDLTHEYYLLTPPDVVSCFDSAATQCSGNADGTNQNPVFCAYHSQTSTGYVYSNIPDVTGIDGCDPFATNWIDCPNFSCSYNNGPADGVLSAISHEHNESITDPQPNNAWTDWGSNVGGEIGDKCNNDAFSDPNLQFGGSGGDAPYNEVVNGTDYLLQREWSNQGTQCLDSFVPNGTTSHASFTSTNLTGNTVQFNAGASSATPGGIAQYVWQFNDGPGQTGTIETTSATISHTFPAAGPYTVALTVMSSDGTSNGTARNITVGGSSGGTPTAAFTAPSGAQGTPLTFDGRSSTDPGGTIATYAWNFGDGSSGSGAVTQHAYAQPGNYTAVLTVTDAVSGRTNAVSHTVTVTPVLRPPNAAFSGPSGGAEGVPVTFDGSGSSTPNTGASITSYSWNFGDGSTGSGALTAHSFHAGTWTVTLTVTDTYGQANVVQHQIAVADEPPTASFNPPGGSAGQPIAFAGSGTDTDGSILAFVWNFGDGASASGSVASHAYRAPGTYTVSLTVVDSSGQSASASHQIIVSVSHTPNQSCVVPKLKGKTVAQAKAALRHAGCGLGKIRQPRKPKHGPGAHKTWRLVVANQSPAPGRREPQGAKISLTLIYKAVKSHR